MLGAGYDDRDLVFARPDGKPTHPELLSATFDRVVARGGLPRIRFHDVRHTHATLLLRAGAPSRSSANGSATRQPASRSTSTAGFSPACRLRPQRCSRG